jgi:hypothetical protein
VKKSGRWQVATFPSRNKPTSFHPSLIFSPEGKTLLCSIHETKCLANGFFLRCKFVTTKMQEFDDL